MRMKRGKDSYWITYKYQADIAIYARCKCGYEYACSSNQRNEDGSLSFKQIITKLYPYCPLCGARKKKYTTEPIQSDELPIYMR